MSDRMSVTESELTDLDDDDEMEESSSVSAQKAYDFILPLIDAFTAEILKEIPLPADRKEDLKHESAQILDRAYQKPHKAAIVGRTEAGKSTLLNALLQHPVLSSSASGACTAVPTEVSYKATGGTEATIEFISRAQWREQDLPRLFEDATDKTVDTEEAKDVMDLSLGYQAREKIIGIFPHLRNIETDKWKIEPLLSDSLLDQYLDTTVSLFTSETETMSFERKLEQFLASDALTGSETRKLWPLVKIVKIRGNFEVLSTGITLVDLPGHGDIDNVRDSVANEYLKSADSVFLVANIVRAKDDRDIHTYLQKHLSQIIVDGRVRQKTISLILTGADNPIGVNECTLEDAEQAKVDALTKASHKLGDEIKDLMSRRDKKQKSKAKKKEAAILQYQEQISQKKQQKDAKNKQRNRLLAHGRCRIVSRALRDRYTDLYCGMMPPGEPAPHIPIFCLGSRDYLCLKNIDLNDPMTFFDPEETGIPRLKRHLEADGERRSLTNAVAVVTSFFEYISRACQIRTKTAGDDGTHEIHDTLEQLEQRCEDRLVKTIARINTAYGELRGHVRTAIGEAEIKSPQVFAGHAKRMKWNQYRAMMRLQGQYEGGNLNTDLVASILPTISKEWNLAVNVRIPLFLSDFYKNTQEDVSAAIKIICAQSTLPNVDGIRKSLGIETFITDLDRKNEEYTSTAQRQGSRTWEPLIKRQLSPQYIAVCHERGGGMFKRMKVANEKFIQENSSLIFSNMAAMIYTIFDEGTNKVQEYTRTHLKRFLQQVRHAFIGGFSDNTASTVYSYRLTTHRLGKVNRAPSFACAGRSREENQSIC
ncbi:hypothetical protein B0H15DRAFT_811413 [Mycena belliarum]|uniref:Dynamin N-terminal domain-containing protein n=1 Tax=Mycena belliarum TaxID=1033014 RepID=A0AAD6UHV0_9AGAR|nr:hypothetical protein B0H15DRAFT_811413 [Mycena belliae]